MLRNRKSFLDKLIIVKDELVSMKLHFRYHTYLYTKNISPVKGGCKYCHDRSAKSNGETANENKSRKDEKGRGRFNANNANKI
jgi:hypothetical protein